MEKENELNWFGLNWSLDFNDSEAAHFLFDLMNQLKENAVIKCGLETCEETGDMSYSFEGGYSILSTKETVSKKSELMFYSLKENTLFVNYNKIWLKLKKFGLEDGEIKKLCSYIFNLIFKKNVDNVKFKTDVKLTPKTEHKNNIKNPKKSLMNEDFKKELDNFKKLINYKYRG